MNSCYNCKINHFHTNKVFFAAFLNLLINFYSGDFTVAIQDGRVPSFIVLGKNMKYSEQLLEATPKNRIFITPDALRYLRMDVQPTLEPSGHILVKVILSFIIRGIGVINILNPSISNSIHIAVE